MALFGKEYMKNHKSIYPNTFYRVSLKAIIRNEKGEVLVVKEKSDSWNLPGGGIDHGETVEQALKRELYEEALIHQPFTFQPLGVDVMFMDTKAAWLMWVVYEVTFKGTLLFDVGPDATEVAFVDPVKLQGSTSRSERLIYRWCVDRTAAFE